LGGRHPANKIARRYAGFFYIPAAFFPKPGCVHLVSNAIVDLGILYPATVNRKQGLYNILYRLSTPTNRCISNPFYWGGRPKSVGKAFIACHPANPLAPLPVGGGLGVAGNVD
jgi:hypothetical protein